MKLLSFGLLAGALTFGQSSVIAQVSGEQSPVIIPVPSADEPVITPVEPSVQPPAPTLEQPVIAPEAPAAQPPAPSVTPSAQPPAPSATPSAPGSTNDLYFLTRAKNLARQAAIQENGGLSQYRPEFSMYGPALQSPFTRNADGTVTFKIKGGTPGASQLDKETEILVNSDASVTVVYNGPSRGAVDGGTLATETNASAIEALDEDSFIARARNLARQAGISENGGLRVYRPEASMFGPTSSAPLVKNPDKSVTFTFKGGAPDAVSPTQETAVTVTRDGTVTVDFNRALQSAPSADFSQPTPIEVPQPAPIGE